jgi:glycosyltransferase involved in cell wall biosynthesis
MSKVIDPRVRFVNLVPTSYASSPHRRWMTQAHAAWNYGLDHAAGSWITSLDDDDEFTSDHVEVLLKAAVDRRLEFVYGDSAVLRPDETWGLLGQWPLQYGRVTHGAFLYSTRLRFLRYDPMAWKLGEPVDWNLMRRMRDCGVRMGYVPEVVYLYYPARLVPETRPMP